MKEKKAYIVIGCPGSGKTWVCAQLKEKYNYLPHDFFISSAKDEYLKAILRAEQSKPLLLEAPFSVSQIKEPLEKSGFKVVPVFIQEDPQTIKDRYMQRENREIPQGHLTRQETYAQRANEYQAFSGTSTQVLNHLKDIKED